MGQDLIEKLKAWGCDVDSALERFDGDKELYLECLKIFISDKAFEDLPECLEKEDFEGAFTAAHTLKGVAGNLSLGPLLEKISEVSDNLKAGDYAMAETSFPNLVAAKKEFDNLMKEGSKE